MDGSSSIGLESDGNLYYNPSTGTVTATAFVGDGSNLTGITASTVGTLTGTNAIAFRDSELNINSSTDGQLDINADNTLDIAAPTTLMSGDLTITGNDLSFGNSETISNQTDNTIAITANTTSLSGDLTVTGNDITFGNGETISNQTDGDFLFTTDIASGAFVLKNSNSSNGASKLELVSDNANEVGDGFEVQSLNGVFTITGDHSTSGTYDDTFVTITGDATPSSSYSTFAGDLRVDGGNIGVTGDTDLLTLASGVATVDGELVVTVLDIGGTNVTATATELNKLDGVDAEAAELNYTDVSTLGTSQASKAVTADSNGDIIFPDNDILKFGTNSDWTVTYDESNDDDLVLTGSDISIESSTSAKPVLNIFNSNADANGSTIKLNKNGSSPATNDVVGNLDFISEDSGNNVTTYGRIQSTIVDVTSGGEEGSIDFYVAENDGTLTKGMEIKGLASDADITVDIPTHDGATGGLKLGGTLVTAEAAELNTYTLNVALNDVSTGSSCFVVAPKAGTITNIHSVINGAITTADAVITANVNGGTNITDTITIANSGSAAGVIDNCVPSDNNTVAAGNYIKLTTNGASDNAVSAVFTITITL